MDRKDFLLEYYKTVREEIMTRIKWRDNWLKVQLLVLITLAALSSKVNFLIQSDKEMPEILFLSLPISVVLCALYFVEDNIIGRLSNYAAAVGEAERDLGSDTSELVNWDNSDQFKNYLEDTLPKRVVAQHIAFLYIPIIYFILALTIFISRLCQSISYRYFYTLAIIVSIFCIVFILYIIKTGNDLRKDARNKKPTPIYKKNEASDNSNRDKK